MSDSIFLPRCIARARAVFFLLLAPWEDWAEMTEVDWRGFRLMDMLHAWMLAQRDLVSESSAISGALDYSLKRWVAWSRYLNDGAVTAP